MSEGRKKILVVEDEILIADNLCRILTSLGYEALEPAINYNEALDALQARADELDMVVLDVNLNSSQTGLDVAAYLKDNYQVPFIFLTSYSDSDTLEQAKKLDPSGYLVKPFTLADIKVTLEMAFHLYEQQAKLNPKPIIEILDQSNELTPAETIILGKIGERKTTNEIAADLGVSPSTVKNHRHNIAKKLNLPASPHSLLNWVLSNQHSPE